MLGVAALALGIVQSDDWGYVDPRTLTALLGAAVMLIWLVRRSLWHPEPILYLPLFEDHDFRLGSTLSFLVAGTFGGTFFAFVQLMNQGWGLSLLQAGLAVGLIPAIAGPMSIVSGRIADRYGHRSVILPGTLFMTVSGIFMYTRLTDERQIVELWLPFVVLYGLGVGLAHAACQSAALANVETARLGIGGAMNRIMQDIGQDGVGRGRDRLVGASRHRCRRGPFRDDPPDPSSRSWESPSPPACRRAVTRPRHRTPDGGPPTVTGLAYGSLNAGPTTMINCGHCGQAHATVAEVRGCSATRLSPTRVSHRILPQRRSRPVAGLSPTVSPVVPVVLGLDWAHLAGPMALGRNVVVLSGQPAPQPWADATRVIIDDSPDALGKLRHARQLRSRVASSWRSISRPNHPCCPSTTGISRPTPNSRARHCVTWCSTTPSMPATPKHRPSQACRGR